MGDVQQRGEVLQSIEFTCPKCLGSTFGSAARADGTRDYMCHGAVCHFPWHESDMWKYMHLSTRRAFTSAEDFQKTSDELNNGEHEGQVDP